MWQAQTPQVFRKERAFQEAYEKAFEDHFIGTDDASLVERLGYAGEDGGGRSIQF
ncbi:MAG: 2-C-methyl-D-erythritol 4-phosphate cytidylyltransferase [Balneolaceae bacterium]|nr:2-C-methyl-D-erythritol 4-phosphate cytidylyltransferase [Balneolaceae bacterium]